VPTIAGIASSPPLRAGLGRLMLIDCPGCAKSYHIIKAALGPSGRRVACPRCDTIWLVTAEGLPSCAETRISAPIPASIELSVEDMLRPLKRKASLAGPIQPPAARRPRGSLFLRDLCTGMALLVFGMASLGFRAEIVRLWPPTSTGYAALGLPVNLSGLELRNLHTVSTRQGAEAVLGIEGEIANVRSAKTEVPPVELAIRDEDGHVLYSWTVMSQKHSLAAGESILFRARLAEPPAGGHDVLARFATMEPETVAWR
jgi:predicted Zn finger-like uncharacterized protein